MPLLDKYLPQDEKQEITPGEAVKGMIMNDLGFANRPLSLSPPFFTHLPLEHLFKEGVEASFFNRHKLGRMLDQCFNFGCENLFSLVSHQACQIEEVNCQFQSLDTTSHSLTGEYAVDEEGCDENIIRIAHGHSKAHRPDLKHASWMNQIEIWFGILMRKVLKRGSFISTDDLKSKLTSFVDYHNEFYAHPYNWKYGNTVLKSNK